MVIYVAPFPLGSSGKRRVEARREGGGDYIVHKTLKPQGGERITH